MVALRKFSFKILSNNQFHFFDCFPTLFGLCPLSNILSSGGVYDSVQHLGHPVVENFMYRWRNFLAIPDIPENNPPIGFMGKKSYGIGYGVCAIRRESVLSRNRFGLFENNRFCNQILKKVHVGSFVFSVLL